MYARPTMGEIALLPTRNGSLGARDLALRDAAWTAHDAWRAAQGRHLVASLRAFAADVAGWPARRRATAELRAMSARELADIGLSRSDIPHVFDADFARRHPRG